MRIPDDHHVVRYCGFQKQIRDPQTRALIGIFPEAFELRQGANEKGLSTNYLEHRALDRRSQLWGVVQDLKTKEFGVSQSAVLAVLRCGQVLSCGIQHSRSLHIYREEHPADPSYATIRGLPLDNSDRALLSSLAQTCCSELVLVKDLASNQ